MTVLPSQVIYAEGDKANAMYAYLLRCIITIAWGWYVCECCAAFVLSWLSLATLRYFIMKGKVLVSVGDMKLGYLAVGGFFGEMALVVPQAPVFSHLPDKFQKLCCPALCSYPCCQQVFSIASSHTRLCAINCWLTILWLVVSRHNSRTAANRPAAISRGTTAPSELRPPRAVSCRSDQHQTVLQLAVLRDNSRSVPSH